MVDDDVSEVAGTNVVAPATTGTGEPAFMHRQPIGQLSNEVRGLILSVRDLEDRISVETLSGEQVKEAFAEMYPPAKLFSLELQSFPGIYPNIRTWLNKHGANLARHSSRRIVKTLAAGIYVAEEATVAMDIASDIVTAGNDRSATASQSNRPPIPPTGPLGNSGSQDTSGSYNNSYRVAHNVAMRFKYESSKFSGDIGQSWNEYVAEYQQVSRDYNLTERQKLQFLHNLFIGDAKRHYLDSVAPHCHNFNHAVEEIGNEYNSSVRQNRVRNVLNTLRLQDKLGESQDEGQALATVYKIITKLAPQVPMSHRGNAHKVQFLRDAVIGVPWATEPLSRIATHGLSFQQLYGELEAAQQLSKESRLAVLRDSVSPSASSFHGDESRIAGVLYSGQGTYARRNTPSWKRKGAVNRSPNASGKRFDPLQIMGCFNCGNPSHMMNQCNKPLSAVKAAQARLEYMQKKTGRKRNANSVLFALCQQLDEEDNEEEDHNDDKDEITDQEIFNTLVADFQESEEEEEDEELHVHLVDLSIYAISEDRNQFEGACLDTGASRSVVGRAQAESYCKYMGIPLMIEEQQKKVFKFGSQKAKSLGKAKFYIPYANDKRMDIDIDVVDVNVPLLLGLPTLDEYKMYVNNVEDLIVCTSPKWSSPITRKFGHLYYEWGNDILYTKQELERIHRHFYHPHPNRVFNLMKRAEDPEATAETLEALEKVSASCEICQRLADQPGRFRVSLPRDDITFNHTLLMDLMSLDSRNVLHIVCKDTLFNAACFTNGDKSPEIWNDYVRIWANVYVGHPNVIHADYGPQFRSDNWKALLKMCNIEVKTSGVESHNALGVGERYHEYLRQVYRKVRASHKNLSIEFALSAAVRAMNCTAGKNGLSPCLLVFGISPRIPGGTNEQPEQRKRMLALKIARSEMLKVIARQRLATAIQKNVPKVANHDISIGSDVLLYKERPVNRWLGPYKVIAGDMKNLLLNVDGRIVPASVDKVKTFKRVQAESKDTATPAAPGARREMESTIDRIISGEIFMVTLRGSLTSAERKHTTYEKDHAPTPSDILVTEILDSKDVRNSSQVFQEAKQKEIDGLKERSTWTAVRIDSIPRNANIVGGRFANVLKNVGTDKEFAKARFVAQGFNDRMKPFIVHNTPTLRQTSSKIMVSASVILGFDIRLLDITQAYLQSKDKLSRDIFIRPRKDDLKYFGFDDEMILKLNKPLYGMCDSGDYWGATLTDHVRNNLEMLPLDGDPSLYMKESSGQTIGLLGSYVDDCLFAGNPDFDTCIKATQERFESKPLESDNFEFLGVRIKKHKSSDGSIWYTLSQPEYSERLKPIPQDISFDKFRSVRAALSWLCHSRPDICCEVNRACQVTEKSFELRHVKALNKTIRRIRETKSFTLKYRPMDSTTLHMRVYSDASFASNDDNSSQLGYIVLLADKQNNCHVLAYSSKKSKRVVRSIMAGEVFAFSAAFDHAFVIQHDLRRILKHPIGMKMFTDSKQLFDVITRASHTTEKRLMVEITAARESYNRYEISTVGLVAGDVNPADGLTKPGICKPLNELLETSIDSTVVSQWIYRSN